MTESMPSSVSVQEVTRLLKVGMERCLVSYSGVSPDYDNARAMLRALDAFGDMYSVVQALADGKPSILIEEALRLLLWHQQRGNLEEALSASGFLSIDVDWLNARVSHLSLHAWSPNVKRLALEVKAVNVL